MKFVADLGERKIELALEATRSGAQLRLNGSTPDVDLVRLSPTSWSLLLDGYSHLIHVRPSREGLEVQLRQHTYFVHVKDELALAIESMGLESGTKHHSGLVTAPIPGLITQISVTEGDSVEKGQTVMVLEAMKMENEIGAPADGNIKSVHVTEGQSVEKGTPLLDITI